MGQWKRAFSNALMVAFGALGGIIGTTTFRSQDAPQYLPGLITVFLVAGITICSVIITTLYMMRQNKRAAKGEIIIEGVPGFRYTL